MVCHSRPSEISGRQDCGTGPSFGFCRVPLRVDPVVNYNFDAAAEKYAIIASLAGIETKNMPQEKIKDELFVYLKNFRKTVGIDFSLSEMGVKWEQVKQLAENAKNDPCLLTNPKEPSVEQIRKIYETAMFK